MFFNSLEYALFLPIVFILYWYGTNGNLKKQNVILLVASYFFYSAWDYRFLALLIFSTLLDYFTSIKIHNSNTKSRRKIWLLISVLANLGFLGFFKYYNFFIDSFASLLTTFGWQPNLWTLNIILPVGISFYTFHGLSYVYDIYNRKITPEYNFIDYSLFVSFFPLLVAGPIERATHLLPQIKQNRTFDFQQAGSGVRQMIWGFFKKVVIADSLAPAVNDIFLNYETYSGGTLVLGVVFFAIQIYGDFSGYSDIALGTAKIFGFDLIENFRFPYFSQNIAEFWKRWHISLSSWFRDYVYIPLGGSREGKWIGIRNVFVIFLISGFWHGANWTFIVWGLVHALFFVPSYLLRSREEPVIQTNRLSWSKLLVTSIRICWTFTLVCFAWIFFRSESLSEAVHFISKIDLTLPTSHRTYLVYVMVILVFDFLYMESRFKRITQSTLFNWILIAVTIFYHVTNQVEMEFIYFQF